METLVKQDVNLTNEITSFFDSKEHYLEFIAAWKKSIADGYHERQKYTHRIYVDGSHKEVELKHPSKLTCVHHLIYNALRKKDLHKSFAPLTSEGKINANAYRDPYYAFRRACDVLDRNVTSRWGRTDWIKEPFGDTVTDEMLIKLNAALKCVKL
jgi:hypothetical protein